MAESSVDVVKRYLEDAIAAERGFEAQFETFARETGNPALRDLFHQHAGDTKKQAERLTIRMGVIGGSPSITKSLLAQLFGLGPRLAQMGAEGPERTHQNLIIAFAIENCRLALFEALATVSEASGDDDTAGLARSIQAEAKSSGERVWKQLPGTAGQAFLNVDGGAGPQGASATV